MLSTKLNEIASAEVVPWEENEYGIAYVTNDGQQIWERIGSRSEAEAIVRRVSMAHDNEIFPKDIAAS